MSYFKDRKNLRNEYSGHEEISSALRKRLFTIVENVVDNSFQYTDKTNLQYELNIELPECNGNNILGILSHNDLYSNIFHALEIFIPYATRRIGNLSKVVNALESAFKQSGSVYEVTPKGEIELRIDEDLAKNISETEKILGEKKKDNLERFRSAVGGLISLEEKPENVIKDIQIAFEDFVKSITSKSDFSESIKELVKKGVISENQRKVLDKIQVYRSNTDGIAHSAQEGEVGEIDALWFIETVIAQIKLIDKKVKKGVE